MQGHQGWPPRAHGAQCESVAECGLPGTLTQEEHNAHGVDDDFDVGAGFCPSVGANVGLEMGEGGTVSGEGATVGPGLEVGERDGVIGFSPEDPRFCRTRLMRGYPLAKSSKSNAQIIAPRKFLEFANFTFSLIDCSSSYPIHSPDSVTM